MSVSSEPDVGRCWGGSSTVKLPPRADSSSSDRPPLSRRPEVMKNTQFVRYTSQLRVHTKWRRARDRSHHIFHLSKYILHTGFMFLPLGAALSFKGPKQRLFFLHMKPGIDINPHSRMAKWAHIQFHSHKNTVRPLKFLPPCPSPASVSKWKLLWGYQVKQTSLN